MKLLKFILIPTWLLDFAVQRYFFSYTEDLLDIGAEDLGIIPLSDWKKDSVLIHYIVNLIIWAGAINLIISIIKLF